MVNGITPAIVGFSERTPGHVEQIETLNHERFVYLINGTLEVRVDDQQQAVQPGGIVHVPKQSRFEFSVGTEASARWVFVESTPKLETDIKGK